MSKVFFLFFLIFCFSVSTFAADKIRVLHTKVIKTHIQKQVDINVNIINAYLAGYVILHYKNINDKKWSEKEMVPKNGMYQASISPTEMGRVGVVYYVEVVDIDGNSIKGFAEKENPQYINIIGGDDTKSELKNLVNSEENKDQEFAEYMNELESIYDVEVVTASKKSEKASDAPATIYVVTESMIKKRGYSNLEDVLDDIPGIEIQHKSVAEYGNYISIRGISGNDKLIILMDGYKISPTDNTPSIISTNYPVIGIKQVEIILGPASALYGPDAVAGIVNIISKKGSDINGVEISGSYGMHKTTNNYFVAGTKVEDLEIMLTGHLYHSDEPYFPKYYKDDYSWYLDEYRYSGKMKILPDHESGGLEFATNELKEYETPTDSYSIHAKLNYKSFELGYFRTQESHNTSVGGKSDFNLYVKDALFKTIVQTAYIKHNTNLFNNKLGIQSSVWFGSFKLHPDSMFNNQYTVYNPGYKYAASVTGKLDEQISYEISDNHFIIAGLTYDKNSSLPYTADLPRKYNENVSSSEQGLEYPGTSVEDLNGNDLTIYQDFHYIGYDNVGTYLQYQGKFFDMINLTLGSRYDYNTRYGSTINPRAGLVGLLGKAFTLKFLFGMAFLAPSPYYSYAHYGAFLETKNDQDETTGLWGPFWRLPNSKLDPEKLTTLETTLLYHPTKYLNFSLNLYYQKLSDIITLELDPELEEFKGIDVETIIRAVNKGSSTVHGGTFRVNSFMRVNSKVNLNPYFAYSYSNGELHERILPYSAKHTIKAGLDIKAWNLLLSTRGLYKTRTYHKFANEEFRENAGPEKYGDASLDHVSSPSYFLLNISARYENLFNSDKFNVSLFLNVNNALNTKHYNVSFADKEAFMATPQDPLSVLGGIIYNW